MRLQALKLKKKLRNRLFRNLAALLSPTNSQVTDVKKYQDINAGNNRPLRWR